MAEETVYYRAKSIAISKTAIFNALAIAAALLGSEELKSLLGPQALKIALSVVAMINMVLRVYSVRPVAFVMPNKTKAVPVEKLPVKS